ncbi:unnamed protein product [Cladocopium goreaui]|uniref:Uncharacterized protein n=1 Tax=Cladocopium goreaui TaxID=2562237 RepID=A0A9P1CD90_9DINO|nr:unnamed protein product [Cladocopium goreaui]
MALRSSAKIGSFDVSSFPVAAMILRHRWSFFLLLLPGDATVISEVKSTGEVLLRAEKSMVEQPISACTGQLAGNCENFLADETACISSYAYCGTKVCIQCAYINGECKPANQGSTCYKP